MILCIGALLKGSYPKKVVWKSKETPVENLLHQVHAFSTAIYECCSETQVDQKCLQLSHADWDHEGSPELDKSYRHVCGIEDLLCELLWSLWLVLVALAFPSAIHPTLARKLNSVSRCWGTVLTTETMLPAILKITKCCNQKYQDRKMLTLDILESETLWLGYYF